MYKRRQGMTNLLYAWLPALCFTALFWGGVFAEKALAQPALEDMINTLKVIAGMNADGTPPATIGGGKVRQADAVYDLQVIAGLRMETADPLYGQQWHLVNTGQKAFATSGGTAGEDLRMGQAIQGRLEGQGVIVAVIDDGLEIGHEDLSGNVVLDGSYNFVTKTNDPSPDPALLAQAHGTACAGIIAAVARNGKGGRGVAPQAALKGFNYLNAQTEANAGFALGGSDLSKYVDIFNMSFGDDDITYSPLGKSMVDQYTASQSLRGGKGAIYVQSSGNGFTDFVYTSGTAKITYKCADETYYLSGVSCQNTAASEDVAQPQVITVGALNALGKKASYSTTGSAIWVSAPGGENGKNSPGILTVDQTGRDRGYSRSDLGVNAANAFETGVESSCGADNISACNAAGSYTSAFCGTSAAAPNISGAVALILTANPNLTRRDVKHILAKKARKVDIDIAELTTTINGQTYTVEQGWVTNKAGYNFHNWYGFGAVHVDDSVAMARSYTENLGTMTSKEYPDTITTPIAIPDNDAAGVTRTITVPDGDDLTIEAVQVVTTITHANTAELGIELTSPSGTKSIVMNIRGGMKKGLTNAAMGVNTFYGEKSKGTWTLRVLDSVSGNSGTLDLCKVVIYGH